MHPAFYVVDHRIDRHASVPFEEKRIIKRGKPEPLRLGPATLGKPQMPQVSPRQAIPTPGKPNRGTWLVRLLRGLRHAPAT